jgi:photosystem II oxygen-evolving enhancer protein 1
MTQGLSGKIATAALGATMMFSFDLQPAAAKEIKGMLTSDEIAQLSYVQVKGTGLANRCPAVKGTESATIPIKEGGRITSMCIEPQTFGINELAPNQKGGNSTQYVPGKMMTRQTYTLTGIDGDLSKKDGGWVLTEQDGIDYAPATI